MNPNPSLQWRMYKAYFFIIIQDPDKFTCVIIFGFDKFSDFIDYAFLVEVNSIECQVLLL